MAFAGYNSQSGRAWAAQPITGRMTFCGEEADPCCRDSQGETTIPATLYAVVRGGPWDGWVIRMDQTPSQIIWTGDSRQPCNAPKTCSSTDTFLALTLACNPFNDTHRLELTASIINAFGAQICPTTIDHAGQPRPNCTEGCPQQTLIVGYGPFTVSGCLGCDSTFSIDVYCIPKCIVHLNGEPMSSAPWTVDFDMGAGSICDSTHCDTQAGSFVVPYSGAAIPPYDTCARYYLDTTGTFERCTHPGETLLSSISMGSYCWSDVSTDGRVGFVFQVAFGINNPPSLGGGTTSASYGFFSTDPIDVNNVAGVLPRIPNSGTAGDAGNGCAWPATVNLYR